MKKTITYIYGEAYERVPVKSPFGKCQKCAFNGSSDYCGNGCDINGQIGCAGIIFKEAK